MAKHTPFFKFDSSAWLGGSIQFTSLESKGLFVDLCALYWESQEPVKIDTKFKVRIRCDEGTLIDLLGTLSDLDIISQSEHGITIPFLDSLMNDRNKWLKKCSNAGKKSATNKGTSSNKKEERRKKSVERREEIEDKKEIELPEFIDSDLWKDFLEVRKKQKAQNTERALKSLINKLSEMESKESGSANRSIEESVMNSWKGVFAPKNQWQSQKPLSTSGVSNIKPDDKF